MAQKLDAFNKILIATSQINYMASCLNVANEQMKFIPKTEDFNLSERIRETDVVLSDVVIKLGEIMEGLGNYINGIDCISPIDERVSKAAFEIIVHGMDGVERDYESNPQS